MLLSSTEGLEQLCEIEAQKRKETLAGRIKPVLGGIGVVGGIGLGLSGLIAGDDLLIKVGGGALAYFSLIYGTVAFEDIVSGIDALVTTPIQDGRVYYKGYRLTNRHRWSDRYFGQLVVLVENFTELPEKGLIFINGADVRITRIREVPILSSGPADGTPRVSGTGYIGEGICRFQAQELPLSTSEFGFESTLELQELQQQEGNPLYLLARLGKNREGQPKIEEVKYGEALRTA